MEVKNFIAVYDNVLPIQIIGNLVRFANSREFGQAGIGGGDTATVNTNIRKTQGYGLTRNSKSFSDIHWHNLLLHTFIQALKKYPNDVNIKKDFDIGGMTDISLLKYENTGHYTWHVDHFHAIPRTMSCILLLNDDYEGGNLCFRNPDGSDEWCVETKSSRLILWPSNFLFPHTVKPVTKGVRYSVVGWAL